MASPLALRETVDRMAKYLEAAAYSRCFIVVGNQWQMKIANKLSAKLRGKLKVKVIELPSINDKTLSKALKALK